MDYTKIEKRILDKILISNFTKRQLKILIFIIRFSYGLNKPYAVLKKRLELEGHMNKPVAKYSGGMIRRLSIASALVHDP